MPSPRSPPPGLKAQPVNVQVTSGPVADKVVRARRTDKQNIDARNAGLKYVEEIRDGLSPHSAEQAELCSRVTATR